MANDFPQVVDKTTLTGVIQADQFLAIGVEGQKDAGGSAVVALPVLIKSVDDANTYFGPASSLASLIKFILGRGINQVWAVASASATGPTLTQRQTAWAAFEDNPFIRIRLTDDMVQADLVALARSCEWAEGVQNKQFAVGQLAASTKASQITAASAILSKRFVETAGGVYDLNGNLLTGAYCAALAACEIAKNPDISDSLNGADIPATGGVEKEAATGQPVYRLRSGAGTPVNDFQDLLTGGVSPFQQNPSGLAGFTHIRTTWTTDTTFDALTTLLIKDQVFIDIRNLLLAQKFLRSPNTLANRGLACAVVTNYLNLHDDWIAPVVLGDGTTGYGVYAVPSSDNKSFTIYYSGAVVRGTNVINISGSLTIPA